MKWDIFGHFGFWFLAKLSQLFPPPHPPGLTVAPHCCFLPRNMSANAADLVPAVEAYLEANGLKDTLSAMKAEAKKKNMTPSKTVRIASSLLVIGCNRTTVSRRRLQWRRRCV